MRRYRITIDGHTYDVQVEDPRARPVVARVDGDTFLVDVESALVRDMPAPGSAAVVPAPILTTQGADQVIAAPIPGTVMKVVAVPGKIIQRGDELLTIEAMKMFNVIRSPRAGTIETVHVVERARVSQGDPLVTFAE
jgi:glutaconyl-CoA/methylmalonyl-CoA decarboxylase subunit gamma